MATQKLFARDIVAYSDEELNRYLEKTGRSAGFSRNHSYVYANIEYRLVCVHDLENLPESFI